MQLLNTPTPQPGVMWTAVRFLASEGKPVSKKTITMYLEPGEEAKNAGPVHHALNTLKGLGLAVVSEDDAWSLAGGLEKIAVDDFAGFQKVARAAILGVDGEVPDPPEDIRRALAWILSRDPFKEAFNWAIVDQVHNRTAPDGQLVLTNDTRWPAFAAWGTALGLIAPAPHAANRHVPDCTGAVHQVLTDGLERGRATDSMSVVQLLRHQLPVVAGGVLATSLGYVVDAPKVAGAALSFALLRGEHEGWLLLGQDSDASVVINLHDPERSSPRICSSITLLEGDDA
ncbi:MULTISPECIES: protein DpdG [unclassified Streptomyces]|uniref:protein DpdG n=1 Tax=unclassified Streptomyces TaxID=2593676 RepID=UPI002DD7F281|nr:protein DpdG [Streptomyces sp. NBC_01788]WSB24507.1 protein DpdG [Streptomyces sp. NBC_01788]